MSALVLLLVGGGVTVWVTVRHGLDRPASSSPALPPLAPPETPVPPPQASPSTAPEASSPETPAPADPDSVQLADSAASAPAAATVQALIQRYSDAINAHDYEAWSATVTPARAAKQPATEWSRGYRSTHDSAILISGIDPTGPDSVIVELSFTSTQDPADAPSNLRVAQICWRTRLPVVNLRAGGRIDSSPPGSTTMTEC